MSMAIGVMLCLIMAQQMHSLHGWHTEKRLKTVKKLELCAVITTVSFELLDCGHQCFDYSFSGIAGKRRIGRSNAITHSTKQISINRITWINWAMLSLLRNDSLLPLSTTS